MHLIYPFLKSTIFSMNTYIETERLILRPWKEEDLLPFSQMVADPLVMEYFPNTLSFSEAEAFIQTLKERFAKNGFSFFATELKSSHEFIGFIGLNIPSYVTPFSPFVEIGWRIASQHWNKGYATEGAKAALDFGFTKLKLKEIVSFTAKENMKSRRIMEKIGMILDEQGEFNHPLLPLGHSLSRHVLYRISH